MDDLAALVAAYWEEYRNPPSYEGELTALPIWAQVDRLLRRDAAALARLGVDAPGLLLALAEAAPDAKGLGRLGAGAIENYLHCDEPNIDGVDEAARRSVKFRDALRCAWFDSCLPSADVERLRRFGPPL
jgi:hypothetical protein